MLDVPEQTRTTIQKNHLFAFGGTYLCGRAEQTADFVRRLHDGLTQCGQQGKPRRDGLGGNFRVQAIEDLVAGRAWTGGPLQTLAATWLDDEMARLAGASAVTLWFHAPLRMERPGRRREFQLSFFDERLFDAVYFVNRLLRRMRSLGVELRDPNQTFQVTPEAVQLLEKKLVWVDLSYGGRQGKTLGGVAGRVTLRVANPIVMAALVWGQYSRVGKNTSFGFGAYRIDELGDDPLACRRALPLLETAWQHPALDKLAMNANLEAGVVSQAIQCLRNGDYRPEPHTTLSIGSGEKRRTLQVPSRRDRVLQRLVLEAIGPGLDQLFEASSFAWRKGLGRHSSARALSRAYGEGYRFAVRADFDRFFDSIVHELLPPKLEAYLGDRESVALLMLWIRAAMGERPAGIPTGAPISPLIGNLLLDRFDERVAQRGGRLIRYGDDFLILYKDQAAAQRMLSEVTAEAKDLELTLNDMASAPLDLDEPFQFLGFQFERFDRWQVSGWAEPKCVEELGWFDASRRKEASKFQIALPGETGEAALDFGWTAILGPRAAHLELHGDHLRCHYAEGRKPADVPLHDLETLVMLGNIGLSSETVRRLNNNQVAVIFADDIGRSFATLHGDFDGPADVLTAQVLAAQDAGRRLGIGRALIRAKVHNYARLAAVLPQGTPLGERLSGLLPQVDAAQSVESLMGTEGHAAAVWYAALPEFLGRGFTFERRVAPNAGDPVNVLLNIAFTLLYRLITLAVRAAGLAPAVGFLHVGGNRFQALATDLQESFRFLAERVVIEATHALRPRDFRPASEGPFPLVIAPNAAREFQKRLWESLHRATSGEAVGAPDEPVAVSYLVALQRQARSLRRHLLNPQYAWQPFQIP